MRSQLLVNWRQLSCRSRCLIRDRCAIGRLAKTDAIDAQVLAQCADLIRPPTRPVPDAQSRELMALVVRRRQLVEMLTAESNRRGHVPGCVERAIVAHIRWLRKQLAEFDAILEEAIRRS